MDFSFSREQEALRKSVVDFCREEISPVADQVEKENRIPDGLKTRLAASKLFGIPFDRKYGGGGAGFLGATIVLEELAKASGAVSLLVGINYLTGTPIHLHGSEAQKKEYLGQLCEGKLIGSFAFTEAATGSDPAAIASKAKLEGSEYVINGSKRFITGADLDGPIVFFAGDEAGISSFIGSKNAPGYSIPRRWEKMGMHGISLVDIHFQDYRVPASNLLGPEGKGYMVLLDTIAIGKTDSAVIMLGLAEAALEQAVKYARARKVRGKPISGMLNIQTMLSDMAIKLEAARWLAYRVAWMIDRGDPEVKVEAAKAKSFITEVAADTARLALRVHGSYGYVSDFKIERLFRDISLGELVEGTTELQKVIVANSLLK